VKLHTIGYAGLDHQKLHAAIPKGATVYDVRLRAWSPTPRWQPANLRRGLAALGHDYIHLPDLGNLLYKTSDEVAIRDIDAIEVVLGSESPVLLCACADWHTCHRRVLADEAVRRDPTIEVIHIEPDGFVARLPL
jgi:uncharacterized protein (DUF488 family)